MNQASTSSVEAAVVTATTVAPESSTKRKIVNDVGPQHHRHQRHQQQSANKRRKKNTGGKSQNNSRKNKNNWIENCSETIHRIPTNCQAPLTCVITRVEIDDEPLLEKKGDTEEKIAIDDARNGRGGESDMDKCTTMGDDDGNLEKKVGVVVAGDSPAATYTKDACRNSSNIASPSESFFSWYIKEKEITLKGVVSSTTAHIDEGKEAKKLFIPVKRHVSVIGPTKVSGDIKYWHSLCFVVVLSFFACKHSRSCIVHSFVKSGRRNDSK